MGVLISQVLCPDQMRTRAYMRVDQSRQTRVGMRVLSTPSRCQARAIRNSQNLIRIECFQCFAPTGLLCWRGFLAWV